MPRRRNYQKNRYCKNTNLSEDEFRLIVWAYANNLNATDAVNKFKEQRNIRISRQTVSRFMLMFGDHHFTRYISEPELKADPGLINRLPLSIYALYRAIYPQFESVQNDAPIIQRWVLLAQSNRIRILIYDSLRDFSRNTKGISIKRFPAWIGRVAMRLLLWDAAGPEIQADPVRFNNHVSSKILTEFIERPLNPSNLLSYRIQENAKVLTMEVLRGAKLSSTIRVPLE